MVTSVEQTGSLLWHGVSLDEDPIRLMLDRRVPWSTRGEMFVHQSIGTGPWPDQGWKLHVSATPRSAADVLAAALDVLLAEGVRFKVVGSLHELAAMNSGVFATSQIGKFITVYPSDQSQAVSLAVELDRVTRGHSGPRIPTDRVLGPGSVVHYRYGSIRRRTGPDVAGDIVYDLLDPAGRLTQDVRLNFYQPPHPDIADPFEAAGVRVPPPARSRLLNGRYLVTDALAQSSRGGVFRAVDVASQPPRLCLVKESWHDVALDPFGRDARDWARNEQAILMAYLDDPLLPNFIDSFDLDGDRYLVIEYIEGITLESLLVDQSAERQVDRSEIVAVGLATAKMLAHLHEIGLVFRDFKPANVVKTPEGGYRLIDFGIAYQYRTNDAPPLSIGTPPFHSRDQFAGRNPSPADDVFAWGAVLHYLLAGPAARADMPQGDDFLRPYQRRPLAELCPVPAELADVVDRAVAWEPGDRYATMRQAACALAEVAGQLSSAGSMSPQPKAGSGDHPVTPASARMLGCDEALALAREVGDALCADAEEHAGGLRWKRRFEYGDDTEYSPDLYAGAAGIGLFLAELAATTGDDRYAEAARGAARWVAGPVWGEGRAQHGFHAGEAGLAYFFVRIAELLAAPRYVDAAAMRFRRLRGASWHTTDVMYGVAGTLLGALALHSATGASEFLDDAWAAAEHLVSARIPRSRKGCFWEVASPAPGGPVAAYLGLLHGSAGIGLALAHFADVTGEEHYLDIAADAAELLLDQATPAPDSPGLTWPRRLGDTDHGVQAHCHGAGGIGQFLLWLDRLRPDQRYRQAAEGAAMTVMQRSARESRPGFCHGLSGAGHFLLDIYQCGHEARWLQAARECGERVIECRVSGHPGLYHINPEKAVSPDLMLGYAGVGSLLLRLKTPTGVPDLVLGRLLAAPKG